MSAVADDLFAGAGGWDLAAARLGIQYIIDEVDLAAFLKSVQPNAVHCSMCGGDA